MSKLTVSLNKNDLYEPWGFRLVGGANHGQALMVQKVSWGFDLNFIINEDLLAR